MSKPRAAFIRISDEEKAEIVRLRLAGKSRREVAEWIGCKPHTVTRWALDGGVPRNLTCAHFRTKPRALPPPDPRWAKTEREAVVVRLWPVKSSGQIAAELGMRRNSILRIVHSVRQRQQMWEG